MPTRPDVTLEFSPEEDRIAHYTCPPQVFTSTVIHIPSSRRMINNSSPPAREPTVINAHALPSTVARSETVIDGPMRDSPSPLSASPEHNPEYDSRQGLSLTQSNESVTSLNDYYTSILHQPVFSSRQLPSLTSSFLRPGTKFEGTQQSDRQIYDVNVEIKHVDMAESFLCGYLRIRGLTDDHPTLTTYFEGEIIGTKYTFQTRHAEWGSNDKVDMAHWARFPAWQPLAKQARKPGFSYKNFAQRDVIFMRWKEFFLVPDHRVRTISGASFEGFYYIAFNQVTGKISGIYFHAKSEKYQQLELDHVADNGCMSAFEFR